MAFRAVGRVPFRKEFAGLRVLMAEKDLSCCEGAGDLPVAPTRPAVTP